MSDEPDRERGRFVRKRATDSRSLKSHYASLKELERDEKAALERMQGDRHVGELFRLIGGRIRLERESRGLSRLKFAKLHGMSVSAIERLEYGKLRTIYVGTLVRLSVELGISLSDLLTGSVSDERVIEGRDKVRRSTSGYVLRQDGEVAMWTCRRCGTVTRVVEGGDE